MVPLNHARRLCATALRLNATMAQQEISVTEEGEAEDEQEMTARTRDIVALEGASCVVAARPGDVLFWYPGVYHRTQDVEARRVALIAEAM